jgi:tetratricopeptide (TPR) repeat protein
MEERLVAPLEKANQVWSMPIKNIAFSLIVVVAFFGALESLLALLGVTPVLLTEDPLVGFAENIPQFTETTRADGTVVMATANNKNGLFNYQEFRKQKDSNSYRIFCMGGSTTYGRPYADRVSFCGWLREYLRAADPTRHWEVINAGGISYASYRVARLMNELSDYQPDLFIVYSGQNEFLEERSYGALAGLPSWLLNLNATLSGTRVYTVMKDLIGAAGLDPQASSSQRYELSGEVDEVLNHTVGPQSYHRDDTLRQQIMTHYQMNLVRMVRIARSAGAAILFIKPAINIKDMSPFKSEHREGLDEQQQKQWDSLYQRAAAFHDSGEAAQALTLYRQALLIDNRYAELHFRIGQLLFSQGQYNEAEKAFRRAVEEDIAPLRILAPMQQIVEQVAASEQVPLVDFPALLRQAYLARYDHAVFGKEFFPDHVHTNMEGYRLLGLALFDQLVDNGTAMPVASWDSARIDAVREEVLAQFDPQAEGITMMNLGKVLDWAGKFQEAYDAFSRACEILGPSPVIYDRLARSSYGMGKPDKAIKYLNEMLALSPDLPGVHSRLAMIYSNRGDTDEAMRQFRAEIEINPEDEYAHTGLAELMEKQGDDAAAIQLYNKALVINSENIYAHLMLARLLSRLQRHDEALAHTHKVLRSNPQQYRAHYMLGVIMKDMGNTRQAVQHFTKALQLNPGFQPAEEGLREMQARHAKGGRRDDLT